MRDLDSATRRQVLKAAIAIPAALALPSATLAQGAAPFEAWVITFRPRALARGISPATYDRVMKGLKPDMGVFALQRAQPEFTEQIWQYLNRRVSEWRIITGQESGKKYAALFDKLEADFGVSRAILLGLWGMETAYGDPVVQQNHMRPIFPCLAALAWGEPRRRKYWESELVNAMKIVQLGWAARAEMRGSWAGAMGHTQWMPEVWLNIGADYDGDGRANPYGHPADALAGTCRYLI
ncbi:MAG: lytic murein transglycosylase, partial [Pseudorhodoplanes sp.]